MRAAMAMIAVLAVALAASPGEAAREPLPAMPGRGLDALNGQEYPARTRLSDFKFSLVAGAVDRFGLHHAALVEQFDGQGHLWGVDLRYRRGGLSVAACVGQFEGLLMALEARYGAFMPGADGGAMAAALEKTEMTRALPGGQSQYRDTTAAKLQGPLFNPDTRLRQAEARRIAGEVSVAVTMEVTENPRVTEAARIPEAVLAVAPNLADPPCGLQVTFRSQNRETLKALDKELGADLTKPQQPKAVSYSVKTGVAAMGGTAEPPDPMVDAYRRARLLNDDEDAEALLGRMTPAEKALAARCDARSRRCD